MTALNIFVGILLTLACVTDFRTRRIPNVLTLSAAAGALLFHLATGGWAAAGWSLGGLFLGAVLFFPMFALRGMGDVDRNTGAITLRANGQSVIGRVVTLPATDVGNATLPGNASFLVTVRLVR